MLDPWTIDYFNPPAPSKAPAGITKPKTPKVVPGIDELFTVQRNALKTMKSLEDLEARLGREHKGSKELTRCMHEAENTYRVIRTWLKDHAS